jgi:membrane-associated phospholipid phosphatase
MDAITALAASVDSPLLHAAGLAIDNAFIYAALALSILLIGERRNGKRLKIAASIALALVLATGVKYALAHDRPCAGQSWCPDDYSFPSIHATAAFALMSGFLNKRSFILYLLFALFVSFTRMNIGVHYFEDIAAALPTALVSYYVIDLAWKAGEAGHGPRD